MRYDKITDKKGGVVMKTKMRRLFSLLLVCFLLVGCTSGAGSTTTTTDSVTTTAQQTTTTAPVTTGTTATQPSGQLVAQETRDLLAAITPQAVKDTAVDDKFATAYLTFALNFLKNASAEDGDENMLISPLSAQLVLAMLANGANGQTRSEIEKALGGLSVDELNRYLHNYMAGLPMDDAYKLALANAVWFNTRSGVNVKNAFLQTTADYYEAALYKDTFDKNTAKEINAWVDDKTDGLLKQAVDDVDAGDVMVLVNALLFEAEWNSTYGQSQVKEGTFNAANGKQQAVSYMTQTETMQYIEQADAVGFAKPYKDGYYSFVALLPKDDLSMEQYIAMLTPAKVREALESGTTSVKADLPKFAYDYETDLEDVLEGVGVRKLFESGKADLSGIGNGGLFVDEAVHKTRIELSEEGTKAGAVTVARVTKGIARATVTLDRPFVYMIVDNTTSLPIFIGTVNYIG